MKWFRWHRGSCENPKFALIATKASNPSMCGDDDSLGASRVRGSVSLTDVIAVWAVILEDAACKDHWGILKRGADYIAIVLRWQPEEVQTIIDEMISEGMLALVKDGIRVVKWDERQYVSDSDPTSNERQKRYYNKHKRKPNALASRPDTDTDTDTEKKESKTGKKILPDAWEPSASHYDLAKKKGLSMESVVEAADEMRAWSLGNGEKRANWDWVFNNWLRRNAAKRSGNGYGGSRALQDDKLSASRAASRLAGKAERGEFSLGPRPGLLPTTDGNNVVLLPKGRDAQS